MWLSEINRKNELVSSFDGAVYLADDGSVMIETNGASVAIGNDGTIKLSGTVSVTGSISVNGRAL